MAFPKLRSGGPINVNFSKWGRKSVLLEGRASVEAQDGKEVQRSREARLTQPQLSQCFPCTLDAGSPSCPAPREPFWHLVLKVALLKCHIEQLQLVAQVGLPPSLGLSDPLLVAKLVVEYFLWQQTHVSVQQEGEN